MTSKEALEHIINNDYNQIICTISAQEAYNGLTREEMTKIIEKDLEVLEHLKQLFYGIKVLEAIGVKYTDMYNLIKNSDDNLIKEWLENESDND